MKQVKQRVKVVLSHTGERLVMAVAGDLTVADLRREVEHRLRSVAKYASTLRHSTVAELQLRVASSSPTGRTVWRAFLIHFPLDFF